MINRCVKFILLLLFTLVLAASSCVGQADDSAPNNNYTVDFSAVKKAALKYFDIQKNMFKDWEGCAISLDNPNRCVNLRGESTGYIFDIALGDSQKGWMAISAIKKWSPLISSGSGSFRKMVEDFRDDRKIGENAKIEHICIDGVMIIFRVITRDRIEHYYASGAGLSAHPYSKLRKSGLLKIQKRNDSMTDKDDFVRKSAAIWDDLGKATPAHVPSGRCGDGVCDEFEKGRRYLCPQDCSFGESAESPAAVNVAAIPAAPNEARIRAKVLDVSQTVYANNEVSKFRLKITDYKNIEGARSNPGEIEAAAYHKNNDVSSLLEIESGDEIEAVLSLSGDEHGTQWQIKEVKINKK